LSLISSKIKTKKIDDENYHYLVVKGRTT